MYKVGLIGNGYWGKILHDKLIQIASVEFICTSKDNYTSKLKDVDWVFVATPNDTHYEIVKNCLWAGKNVFCEKPLTPTYEQSKKLYKLAKMRNVKLFVDEVFWYRSELIDLHHAFSHSPKKLKCTWNKCDFKSPNSVFCDMMYHDLYMLQIYLKNKKLISVDKLADVNEKLHFKAKFDDVEIEFLYDRRCVVGTGNPSHCIGEVNLERTEEDALGKMITLVLRDGVIFDYNKERSLFANKMIDEFKSALAPKVAVVGGGIFGCTTAWKLAKEGYNVTLYEKNNNIISQASNINQYRLHRGYHYPRSEETAEQSLLDGNVFHTSSSSNTSAG